MGIATSALGLYLAVAAAASSAPAAAEAPTSAPAIQHVEVRVFEYPFLARDAGGRAVTDLEKKHLALLVDGRERSIADLWSVQSSASGEELPYVQLAIDGVADGDPAATVPGESAHYVLFLDLANDPPANREDAARAVMEPLRTRLRPQDLVAVVSYDGNLALELPFTANRDLLSNGVTRALGRARPADSQTAERIARLMQRLRECQYVPDNPFSQSDNARQERTLEPDRQVADEGCVKSLKTSYRAERRRRTSAFLDALAGAAQFAGGIQGHVTVLAISHGDGLDADAEFSAAGRAVFGARQTLLIGGQDEPASAGTERLGALLRRAAQDRVSFVFVDPSTAPPTLGAGESSRGVGGVDPAEAAYRAARSTLQTIADGSAGSVIVDRDLAAGLTQAIDAENGRYVLTFYGDPGGDRRKPLTVSLSAVRPDLQLQGGTVLDTSGETERWAPAAVAFGDRRQGAGDRPGTFIPFVVGVRQSDMDFESAGDEMFVDLSLQVMIQTIDGRELVEQYQLLHQSVPKSTWDDAGKETLRVRGSIEAADGDYLLGAVFRNARTGRKAVVYREIRVPAP